jgi:IS30 family transposase
MAKKTKLSQRDTRIKIKALHQAKMSPTEIAYQLNITRKTVYKWINSRTVERKKGSGRPSTISSNTKRTITRSLKEKVGSSLRKTAKKLNFSKSYQQKGKTISYSTINNYVKSKNWGIKAYKRPYKPLLSIKNIEDRLKFGKILIKKDI